MLFAMGGLRLWLKTLCCVQRNQRWHGRGAARIEHEKEHEYVNHTITFSKDQLEEVEHSKVNTTEEELEAYRIVVAILRRKIPISRIRNCIGIFTKPFINNPNRLCPTEEPVKYLPT